MSTYFDPEVQRIAKEFIAQLRRGMVRQNLTQTEIARRLGISQSAVCQFFKGKGFTLRKAIMYARAVGMKTAIVIHEANAHVSADSFVSCWEASGKPRDFFDLNPN